VVEEIGSIDLARADLDVVAVCKAVLQRQSLNESQEAILWGVNYG
jgi:hypothetical protein